MKVMVRVNWTGGAEATVNRNGVNIYVNVEIKIFALYTSSGQNDKCVTMKNTLQSAYSSAHVSILPSKHLDIQIQWNS